MAWIERREFRMRVPGESALLPIEHCRDRELALLPDTLNDLRQVNTRQLGQPEADRFAETVRSRL
jgi:hypothetical protein